MRILLAGAAGAIGRQLVPALVAAGHEVTGTTRDPDRRGLLESMGARPLIMDALDRASVVSAVTQTDPEVVIHQLTDLARMDFEGNARVRILGTRHLVDAALTAGVSHMIAQSISWVVAPGSSTATESEPLADDALPGVRELESAVAEMPVGVVLRYGYVYGPGTWFDAQGLRAEEARAGTLQAMADVTDFVHVGDAAQAAVDALAWPAGIYNIVDGEPAPAAEWIPAFAAAVGAPVPNVTPPQAQGRPVSNAKARAAGWTPRYASWREGFRTFSA